MDDAVAQRIARRFASLSREHRRVAYEEMRRQGLVLSQLPILSRDPDRPVLSYAQARQWFLWKLDPASTAYQIASGLRLTVRPRASGVANWLSSICSPR